MRNVLQWYQSGGPFMMPLLVVGILGVLLLFERVVHVVTRSKIHARPFIERVIALVRAGKLEDALALCAEHQSALPDLGLVILRSRGGGEADLLNVAKASALTLVPGLRRRLSWLPMLAIIAMLLGCLGGIANLHDALLRATDPITMGVAYALRPLGTGVLMAIPLIAGYAYLVTETEKLVSNLEEFATRLISALMDRPDVRLGHRS